MADNQKYFIRKVKDTARDVLSDISWKSAMRGGGYYLSTNEGNSRLAEMIRSSQPFMVSRLGSEESRTLEKYREGQDYTDRNIHNIMYNAGVFPNDKSSIDSFCGLYSSSLSESDMCLVWGCVGEKKNILTYCKKNIVVTKTEIMHPFLESPWTLALEGKKVLIVHPFVETIKRQYKNRDKIFGNHRVIPDFEKIETVKAIQSNSGEHEYLSYTSYFEVLDATKKEIDACDFDVALIGAGAYGLPLCSYVKSIGKQSVYMASSLQILFGIRGKRWDAIPFWQEKYNEYWVYPDESETPKHKELVEGGSYWK